ncbi:MAG: aarF domain-containing kinase [Bacillariaceae sp.]
MDVGITTVHSESDHRLISDVLAAFIRCDGRKAGRSMIDDSNTRLESIGDHSIDAEKFIDKMEQLTIKAQGENYFMEHLGTYISHICQCAATHHVMINQAFISAALAVKVQEGIALALDPSIEIWKIAIPVIMEGERKHGRAAERAKEILGFDRFVGWLTGNKNDVDGKDKAKDH